MCMTCGCNDAHKEMGNNITYEDLRHIAAGNGKTVDETLAIMFSTAKSDRAQHAAEYATATEPIPGEVKIGHDWDRREWAGEEIPTGEDVSQRWNAGEWAGEENIAVDQPAGAGPTGGGHAPGEQHWARPKK